MISGPDIPGHELLEVLGRGGFGVVFRARQLAVLREVAVKVDSRALLSGRDQRRFRREVTAAGQLSGHPHVIDLYDAGILADGRPYLVMELCPGGSLDVVLRARGPLPPEQVRDLGIGIADALAAAHAAGVLHRDVKPANILTNRFGLVGLADFGLASILDADGAQTATVEALTPAYAAPEAFQLGEPTPLFDVYSLAATLYALLAGRPPRFPPGERPSIATIIALHGKEVVDVPGVPPALMDVLRQALEVNPARRLPSAAELRDALAGVDLHPPVSGPPPLPVPLPLPPTVRDQPLRRPAAAPLPLPPTVRDQPLPATPGSQQPTVRNAPLPPTVHASREHRTLVLGALAMLAVLAGIGLLLQASGLLSGGGRGATSTSTSSRSTQAQGAGTAGAAGLVTCAADQAAAAARCPQQAECWGGPVYAGGVLTAVRSIPCTRAHRWQTFAVFPIPTDVQLGSTPDNEVIAASPTIRAVCSTDVLHRLLAGQARAIPLSAWGVDVLTPTQQQFDAGARTIRCIATVTGRDATGSAVAPAGATFSTAPA